MYFIDVVFMCLIRL